MPQNSDTVDHSLADGTSVFAHDGRWALRRRDGAFVRIGGGASRELGTEDPIAAHPVLGPAFAGSGFLRTADDSFEQISVDIHGEGVLRDRVGGLLAGITDRNSGSRHTITVLDAPPARDHHHGPGVVVWPEGASIFISPFADPADQHPVTTADVLRRRIAAAGSPELLAAYFAGRRRAPVDLGPGPALLVTALVVDQIVAGHDARRRLRVVDVDAWTWSDHMILPLPDVPPKEPT